MSFGNVRLQKKKNCNWSRNEKSIKLSVEFHEGLKNVTRASQQEVFNESLNPLNHIQHISRVGSVQGAFGFH